MANTPPIIPDYELIRSIGSGSYGEVWLARSITGAYRAVKIIHRSSFDHDRPYEREFGGIQRFEPISRSHESQVNILHVGRNDSEKYFYYVMELGDDRGGSSTICPETYLPLTLKSLLQSHARLQLGDCLEIGIHLATALEYLHKNNLVHRDVKPTNVIFVQGLPKLADIGLITSSDATRSFVGTEGYLPPEGPGSPQGDLYALGMVLYELSTGLSRFDFPELPSDWKDSSEAKGLAALNDIILKACDGDPQTRYQTAAAMREDLLAVKAGKPSKHKRVRWLERKWMASAVIVAAFAAAFLGNLIFLGQPDARRKVDNPQHNGAIAIQLPAGLVSRWKADGDSTDSVGSNHGTLHGQVYFEQGLFGGAFFCNGGYVEIADSPSLNIGPKSSATFTAWARRTDSSLPFHIFGKRLKCEGDRSTINYQLGIDASCPASPVNEWVFWALVDVEGHPTIYTNGLRAGTLPDFGATNSAPLRIGASGECQRFHGFIEDVCLYNRALTAEEIQGIYKSSMALLAKRDSQQLRTSRDVNAANGQDANTGLSPAKLAVDRAPDKGLVAWWRGDLKGYDALGLNHAALHKGVGFAPGLFGTAFALDNGAHLAVANGPICQLGTNDFSIALWAKMSGGDGAEAFVACDDGQGLRNKWIFWENFWQLRFHITHVSDKTGLDIGTADFRPRVGEWNHVAVIREKSVFRFYLNGTSVCAVTNTTVVPYVKAPLTVGLAEGKNMFRGLLDDIRIYNRALSAGEVKKLHDQARVF